MKHLSVTIQMKVTEQYFPVVLFIIIMLYKVVLTFEFVDEILTKLLPSKMKATDFYFAVSLFIMLYKVILSKIKTALPILSSTDGKVDFIE